MDALIIKLNGKAHAAIAPEYSPGTVSVVVMCHLNSVFTKRRGQLFRLDLRGMQESKDGAIEVLRWPKVSLNRGDTLSVQRAQVKRIDMPSRLIWDPTAKEKPPKQKILQPKSIKKETQMDALEVTLNREHHATIAPHDNGVVYIMVSYELDWRRNKEGAYFEAMIGGVRPQNDETTQSLKWPDYD